MSTSGPQKRFKELTGESEIMTSQMNQPNLPSMSKPYPIGNRKQIEQNRSSKEKWKQCSCKNGDSYRAQFSSVQFSRSVMSDSLQPHESQHARPPCPSPTPRVYSNSCPSSRWCHPAISSSVVLFSSCPNPSQHQDLFQWVNSLHEVAKVLEFQPQHQSFQWTPRTGLL